MNNLILKNGCFLKEINDEVEPFFGNLVIKDGYIFEHDDNKSYDNYEIINLGGRLVTKPLTNFHEHIYSKLAKGFNINSTLDSFEKILTDYWWKEDTCLTKESVYYSALLTGIDSIKNGVGFIFDHHSSPNFIDGSLETIADVLNSLSINNVLCYEITDRNGKDKAKQSVEENFNFLAKNFPLSKGMIGLHASFTIDDSTLQTVAKLNENINSGIHVHICEGEEDRIYSIKKYGKSPFERFVDLNLINEKSILAHGVKLNSKEIEYLRRYNIPIAINIDSNLNNSVGIHNFNLLDNSNILLGTDGMHSNILKSYKNIFLILRYYGLTFEKSFEFIKNIYKNSNIFLKKYFNYSQLNFGDTADCVVWDYIPQTPVTKDNIWGHIIYGLTESRAKHFIKNGKFLMKDFNIEIVDEDKINFESKKASFKLFNEFSKIG
jgi:cytosine/adenosine deaminase-related metal-dependent hydrolase